MAVEKGDLAQEWALRARERAIWQRDFIDLNREMAGIQGSRIKRFTSRAEQVQTKEKQEEDDTEDFLTLMVWLDQMSESYRQSYERLSRTINDAQKAYLLSLDDIQGQKEEAALALEKIRENALVLEDGRRVYFARDGAALFDDDGQQISDDETIAAAREAQERKPDASTHEEHKTEIDRLREVEDLEREVFEKLRGLEELKIKMEVGDLSQDDLDRENQAILDGLSPDVRKLFDRVQENSTNTVDGDTQKTLKNSTISIQQIFEKAGNGELNPRDEPFPLQTPIPLPLNFQS